MNQIIQRLMTKTGLPEDNASAAVDAIPEFLKEKRPGPIGAQLDSLMAGKVGAREA